MATSEYSCRSCHQLLSVEDGCLVCRNRRWDRKKCKLFGIPVDCDGEVI